MAGLDETAIIELGKRPISDAAPGGQDVADDEEYLALEAETAKLDRIDLGEPDWIQIEQSCLSILKTKSKDVQVACALAFALFKRARYAGLAAVLGLLLELTNNFWDNLFPDRPRRRKSRIEALGESFGDRTWFRDAPPRPDEFDAIDQCAARLEQLKAALTQRMPDEPPDFGKFARKLKELAGTRPKPAQAAQPAAGAPTPGATAGGAAFTPGEVKDVSGALNAILNAAAFQRKADATDPVPYALVRVVKWSRIELPTTDAAKHGAQPPEKSVAEALTFQFTNGVWEHLLNNAEAAFRANDPLWLDLQRYTCAAMQGLGAPYAKARAAVMDVTGQLVRRLGPGIYDLAFSNGTPLCSGETKMWIEAELAQGQGGAGGRAGGAAASDGKLTEATDAARKLAGSGKLTDAVKTLQEGLAGCVQRRDRLLWKLRIAELCHDAKRLQLAASLLDECWEEVRRYHVEEWEPSLAVEVAQALYRCRKALTSADKQPTPEALAGVRDSFTWLCQLDPLAALAAEPAGK